MSLTEEFQKFWVKFPRKTAKLDAIKAYAKARTLASAAEILDGVDQYRAHLPDEAQFICHPSTFLNQGRWMDEYETVQRPAKVECEHTPRCNSPVWCEVLRARSRGEVA